MFFGTNGTRLRVADFQGGSVDGEHYFDVVDEGSIGGESVSSA